jgi:hypothetical protein
MALLPTIDPSDIALQATCMLVATDDLTQFDRSGNPIVGRFKIMPDWIQQV